MPPDKRSDALLHVTDMGAHHFRVSRAPRTPNPRNEKKVRAPQGKSMLTCWKGDETSTRSDTDPLAGELLGRKAARLGDRKATWLPPPPFGRSEWQLFNLESDPGEVMDPSSETPDMARKLIQIYDDYAKRCGVVESSRDIDL